MFHSLMGESTVINAHPELAGLLALEENWCSPWAEGRSDESLIRYLGWLTAHC
jgi:hypothetical protein